MRYDIWTPLTIRRPNEPNQPVYRSVTECPACSGEGQTEVMLPARSPVQESPEHEVRPCEVCGTEDTPGTGHLPVLRCASCDGIIRQDEIEGAMNVDDDFSDALADVDPDERLLWHRHPDLSPRDRKHMTFCECPPEAFEATNHAIDVVLDAARRMVQIGRDLEHIGAASSSYGVHDLPGGILLHLTNRPPMAWSKPGTHALPHRFTGTIVVDDGPRGHVGTYSSTIHADHSTWAVDARLAVPAESGA